MAKIEKNAASAPNNTRKKQGGAPPFQPGQSGNPNGRPKGSRNKISEAFLQDFYEAWKEHGQTALLAAAQNKPTEFVKIAASLLPRELHVKDGALEGLTDDELEIALEEVRAAITDRLGKKTRRREEDPNSTPESDRFH
jgi:hypothetical protein